MKCNPYLPFNEYLPDGEPHVFEGRLYLYGSHDEPNVNQFCPGDYVVWSCSLDDLTDWKYEGISYRRTDDPHNTDNVHALFAPDVAKGPDGYYYLYYCLDFQQEIGVAKSNCPQGPFSFYGHVHYPDQTLLHEYFPYDPSVLVDDDGSVYLYYGFAAHFSDGSFGTIIPSPGCMVIELYPDMLTVKNAPVMCLPTDKNCDGTSFSPEHAYFEAPSMRKINNIYYLVYSSQSQHELCYATSKYPNREFTYRGVIISNGDIGLDGNKKPVNYIGTNHGGLAVIQNDLYIFYHRNTHGLASSRQGCAEKLSLSMDGYIPQVGISSYGLYGRPFFKKGSYSAFAACYLECLDTSPQMKIKIDYKDSEPCFFQNLNSKEQHYITGIRNRCLFGYNAFELEKNVSIVLTLRSYAFGTLLVSSDRIHNTILGQAEILPYEQWKDIRIHLTNTPGVSKLYITFLGKGSLDVSTLTLL